MEAKGMAGHLIRRLHQHSTQVFQQRVKEAGFDMTPVQFAALDALKHKPAIDQITLAGLIAYDRVTIGGVIDRLVGKGWVQRKINEKDRRARVVELTPQGRHVLDDVLSVAHDLQHEILARLDPAEHQAALALIRKALGD